MKISKKTTTLIGTIILLAVVLIAICVSQKQGLLTDLSSQAGDRHETKKPESVSNSPHPNKGHPSVTNNDAPQPSAPSKSLAAPDPGISRQDISEVKTRQKAVELHRILTLRFLKQLEIFASSSASQAHVRQELEDTADRYYLLEKITKIHAMKPLGAESLTEAERDRVEKLIKALGYSTPTTRAADAAFSKFDLLRDEHIVNTLRKWLDQTP